MQISGFRIEIEFGGQAFKAFGLRINGGMSRTELLGFFESGFTPCACDNVIGRRARCTQVHGQHCELQGCAALQEKDFVVGGNAEQFAQVRFGGMYDALEFFRPMADLHHRHTSTLEVQHFGLGFLQDFQGQSRRTWVEVINAFGC